MSQAQTKIGVATATIVGMNAMIGAGIFSIPSAIAAHVGPASILAFIFVVISIWFMAASIARLAALFPEEGAFYVYAKQWCGHIGGMITVNAYLIGLLIAMGLLCKQAGIYMHTFFPYMDPYYLGIATLLFFISINMFGIPLSTVGQHILIACTVFPLIAITLLCLGKANWHNLFPFAPHGFAHVMKATRIVIFSFFGFECAASLFNVVENPAKNVPRALAYSILIVGTIYTLFITSILLSVPTTYFVDPSMRISGVIAILFPDNLFILTLIDFSILSAILGTVHSMIWASSNLLQDIIAKMRNAPARYLITHSYINTGTTVFFVGLCILLSYITFESMDLFFYFTALFIVFAYIMSMITLLTLKSEWKNQQNINTILGIITATAILVFAFEGVICELI